MTVPPLRARPEDILPLARHFAAQRGLAPDALLTDGIKSALSAHGWPGNVRELRNAIERLLAVGELGTGVSGAGDAPLAYNQARAAALDGFEREYCRTLMRRAGGVVTRAAAEAGISRQMFHRLLRKHDLAGD